MWQDYTKEIPTHEMLRKECLLSVTMQKVQIWGVSPLFQATKQQLHKW